jgi:hypothetical protein
MPRERIIRNGKNCSKYKCVWLEEYNDINEAEFYYMTNMEGDNHIIRLICRPYIGESFSNENVRYSIFEDTKNYKWLYKRKDGVHYSKYELLNLIEELNSYNIGNKV